MAVLCNKVFIVLVLNVMNAWKKFHSIITWCIAASKHFTMFHLTESKRASLSFFLAAPHLLHVKLFQSLLAFYRTSLPTLVIYCISPYYLSVFQFFHSFTFYMHLYTLFPVLLSVVLLTTLTFKFVWLSFRMSSFCLSVYFSVYRVVT
jgi:hypothetical protein